jgi:hypothetical protein
LSESTVVPGQLRRWNNSADEDCGKLFLVLATDGGNIWRIHQDGTVREWLDVTVRTWSEVVDG